MDVLLFSGVIVLNLNNLLLPLLLVILVSNVNYVVRGINSRCKQGNATNKFVFFLWLKKLVTALHVVMQCTYLHLYLSLFLFFSAGVFCAIVSHPADTVVSKLNNDVGSTPIQAARDLGMRGEVPLNPEVKFATVFSFLIHEACSRCSGSGEQRREVGEG